MEKNWRNLQDFVSQTPSLRSLGFLFSFDALLDFSLILHAFDRCDATVTHVRTDDDQQAYVQFVDSLADNTSLVKFIDNVYATGSDAGNCVYIVLFDCLIDMRTW